jgi:sodium ion-translocating decarboxylase beta subunit
MTNFAPIFLFFGVGAMTDLGPLLARPSLFLISAMAQAGQFVVLLVALGLGFGIKQAAAIGVIAGANGPVTVFMATHLAPELLGPIVVTAYLYMALVHMIQPPIMRLLTTEAERKIAMTQLREVSYPERIAFILTVTALACLLLPVGTPLFAFFMAGNLLRESKKTDRLAGSAANEITNIFILCLVFGLSYTLAADKFLRFQTLLILGLGLLGFASATVFGVLTAKVLNWFSPAGSGVNPLIGAAGLAAVPHSPRAVQIEGRKANPDNWLIMHAMGPNLGAIIASSVVACVIYSLLAK